MDVNHSNYRGGCVATLGKLKVITDLNVSYLLQVAREVVKKKGGGGRD